MMIVEKLTKLSSDVTSLIDKSNQITKKYDETLNKAVDSLIDGYGKGGDTKYYGIPEIVIIGTTFALQGIPQKTE